MKLELLDHVQSDMSDSRSTSQWWVCFSLSPSLVLSLDIIGGEGGGFECIFFKPIFFQYTVYRWVEHLYSAMGTSIIIILITFQLSF